jgi:FAD dependent oxidoreductase TIGR03364
MSGQYDVAVIGGGIVGLAHAWMATRRGLRVVLLERSPVAQGASVRNFGMIWPVGQPLGELHDVALRSRALWLELAEAGGLEVDACGSIHLAHRPDELAVLEEFCSGGFQRTKMIGPDEVLRRSPLANPEGLLGGMLSDDELRVDPRTASAQISKWLVSTKQVECYFGTFVTGIDRDQVIAADGRRWNADRVIICSGSDLKTLFPEILLRSGLRLCKLQMLKGFQLPESARTSPHLASGLTLRHYDSFKSCPSLEALRRRVADETPELDRYGIHVMASWFGGGDVILGDSHEYDDQITPFDKTEIDDLMLRELRKVIRLRDWSITQRWHGIYATHPSLPVYECQVDDRCHVFVGTGGAGMTMSFGLADRAWQQWIGESK